MPRPQPPPTPGSSSDIRGKVGTSNAPTFNLPPTAYPEADRASNSSSAPSNNGSDSSYNPVSPGTTAQNPRKRPVQPAMSVITKDDFSLPPPPTRSRKIIQMKPREMEQETTQQSTATSAASKNTGAAPQTGGKKNNSKNTTAAGRKIARKTAHSLIERRRRSKMNEEFSVLKDMIPACQGQDMHKLAILSAGIEYLRYLEQCVTDLQAQNNNSPRPPPPAARPAAEEDFDSDDEMAETQDAEPPRPSSQNQPLPPTHQSTTTQEQQAPLQKTNSIVSLPSLSQMTTNSPSIFSGTASARHYSISSTSQASYSPYIHSNQASPAFGPQLSHIPQYTGPQFGLGSPALQPLDSSSQAHQLRHIAEGASDQLSAEQSRAATPRQGVRSELELDQEATAALLMLNSDRRQWRGMGLAKAGDDRRGSGAGGMSVRDLLSG